MKKRTLIMALVIALFLVFAVGSSEEPGSIVDQGSDSAATENNEANLGNYHIVIDSCRLAKDYEGNDIVIVKYMFTNVSSETAASFYTAITASVFQDGIGLNECLFVDDSANYSADNQTKEIKQGATIAVEVAYTLNDTSTDIEVEAKEWISFSNKTVTKTFSIK